jgi:hypothetical protein
MGVGAMLFGQSGQGEIVAKASWAYAAADNPKTAHRLEATEERIFIVDRIKCLKIQTMEQKMSVGVKKTKDKITKRLEWCKEHRGDESEKEKIQTSGGELINMIAWLNCRVAIQPLCCGPQQ